MERGEVVWNLVLLDFSRYWRFTPRILPGRRGWQDAPGGGPCGRDIRAGQAAYFGGLRRDLWRAGHHDGDSGDCILSNSTAINIRGESYRQRAGGLAWAKAEQDGATDGGHSFTDKNHRSAAPKLLRRPTGRTIELSKGQMVWSSRGRMPPDTSIRLDK
jgi:hypothetical protein